MQTLTYGLKKPDTNDKGPVVFPAMGDNLDQLDSHNHNGTNSSKLPGSSIEGGVVTLASGSWILITAGVYRQQLTIPAGYDYDKVTIGFRLSSGDYVFPTVEKISATQAWVYTNDNTLTYVAVVGG